jgi:arylformamidase
MTPALQLRAARAAQVTSTSALMELIDISVPIRPGMIIYPGDPEVALERVESIAEGADANISRLSLGVHTGTHLDAPLHFFDGAAGSEAFQPETLVGRAVVVDATSLTDDFDEAALAGLEIPDWAERVLLKTTNGHLWEREAFSSDFVRLTGSGARHLVGRGVRLVGIDYLSIGDHEAHRELLGNGVIPLEGLDLRRVEPGEYRLVCLPLRLEGSDGVPARAILVRE